MEVANKRLPHRREPDVHEGDFKLLKLFIDFPFSSAHISWGGDGEGLLSWPHGNKIPPRFREASDLRGKRAMSAGSLLKQHKQMGMDLSWDSLV